MKQAPDFDSLNERRILESGPVAPWRSQLAWALTLAGVVLACALLHWMVS